MSEALTKDYLDKSIQKAVTDVGRHFNQSIGTLKQEMDERFDKVDERLVEIGDDVRLLKRAVLDLAADAHLHNLVRELRAKGIELDESKIFLS